MTFQPVPLTPSVAWDPYGFGGLFASDPRYAWNSEARCYSMLCESCGVRWADVLDVGFYVCLSSCKGGGR